ncbi:MAG: class I adenylate-forming enzyme family protein [Solirubrobacterales bacterium]|nr:class I adenylate-forming enzyme family protein [Solirubrobacterales bacterium]
MVPDAQSSFYDLYALRSRGGSPSIADAVGSWSGEEAYDHAVAAAEFLAGLARPTERIALELQSGRDWVAFSAGAWLAGLAVVPIDSRWPRTRRENVIESCAVHITVTDLDRAWKHLGGAPPVVTISADDPALVLFTSGTTGTPKEVVHSRSSVEAQARAGAQATALSPASRWLIAIPLTHAGGIGAVVRCLHAGSAMTLRQRFDGQECMELLQMPEQPNAITHVSLVPTMLQRFITAGLSGPPSLEMALIGGAPLDSSLRQEAVSRGIPVSESWGMTETLGLIALGGAPESGGEALVLEGLELRVGDDSELLVRGPIVAPSSVGEDRWLHTGDVGSFAGGRLKITGRLGSLIISGGENISPEMVEAALRDLHGVADAYVYGVADTEWGQRVEVDVVLSPGVSLDPEGLRLELSSRLSPWEVPKRFSAVDEIKRDQLGKIDRSGNDRSS